MGRPSAKEQVLLDQKKAAIRAIVDFNEVYGVSYKKGDLHKFFEVDQKTAWRWLTSTPPWYNGQLSEEPLKTDSSRLKRQRSVEDEVGPISPTSSTTPLPKRRNPVRNDGRDRERLKLIIEDLGEPASTPSTPASTPRFDASPSPPQQLLTPPSGRKSGTKKSIRLPKDLEIKAGLAVIKSEPDVAETVCAPRPRSLPSQLQMHV